MVFGSKRFGRVIIAGFWPSLIRARLANLSSIYRSMVGANYSTAQSSSMVGANFKLVLQNRKKRHIKNYNLIVFSVLWKPHQQCRTRLNEAIKILVYLQNELKVKSYLRKTSKYIISAFLKFKPLLIATKQR